MINPASAIISAIMHGFAVGLATLALLLPMTAHARPAVEQYNVVWTTPGENAAASMPVGNGEVGLNVWAEVNGDIVFYIARTDSWSENARLLKLGRVRLKFAPNPFARRFRQELHLRDGRIQFDGGLAGAPAQVEIFVDAAAPVIHVSGKSQTPLRVTATLENWRTTKRVLAGRELESSWTMHDAPPAIEVWEAPDVLLEAPDAVAWYHRNEHSVVPLTFRHQGLETLLPRVRDPLLHRTFGGWMRGAGFSKRGRNTLTTPAPRRRWSLQIATHTAQTATAEEWRAHIEAVARTADAARARRATARWWRAFWERSWIFVEGDAADFAGVVPANEHALRLGCDAGGGNHFRGLMRRASFFNRALSAAAIERLAAAPQPPAGAKFQADFSKGPVAGGGIEAATDNGAPVARFTGTGCVEAANSHAWQFPDGFTGEAWIRPDEGNNGRLLDKITPGGSDGFLWDLHPAGSLRLIVGNQTLSAPGVKFDAWQHVAATFEPRSGNLRLFLNGKLLKESARGDAAATNATASPVTRAYVLQRWIQACGGRGRYPIKFNGSIFTVDPALTDANAAFNPDWRRWGGDFWWQNTRLPYYPMLACGDFEMMAPLWRLYRDALPVCRERARLYHGVQGAYFPETMTIFGTYSNGDYGWDRTGRQPNEVLSPWWQYTWQQGLELVSLMLDYYDYTGDERFLREQILPLAREVLLYYDTRFGRDANGTLVISPTQVVETYWHGVVNDTPSVAGLHAVLGRLRALPPRLGSDRALWERLNKALPPLPQRREDGKTFTPPAEKFDPRRSNVENGELYAVFPFRLFGLGRPGLEIGRETFRRRIARDANGWQQDGQEAALLGLTRDAKENLLIKARNTHPGHRFPAMWGPNYDWLPDQDHGSNLMTTLQTMLLQAAGEKILLLPAWPREWNISFKLHAPRRTTVECVYRNRRIEKLIVTPAARARDVQVMSAAQKP